MAEPIKRPVRLAGYPFTAVVDQAGKFVCSTMGPSDQRADDVQLHAREIVDALNANAPVEAGLDDEALARVAYDAVRSIWSQRVTGDFEAEWDSLEPDVQEEYRAVAQAVAARVAARYATEVAALRDALADVGRFADAHHSDEPPHVWLHALTIDIPDQTARALADPSPAVRRIEAEARLGRAYLAWRDDWDGRRSPVLADDRDAALAALRALKTGVI